MAQFNLADYETVEERIKRLYEIHPDARIVTENLTTLQDRQVSTWVVRASIYLTREDQLDGLVKATGLAFEVDGQGMAQKTAALETAETSAIGRALANMNLSGNKRTSREEMAKAERGVTPTAPTDWPARIAAIKSKEEARQVYNEARTRKAGADILDAIKVLGESFA